MTRLARRLAARIARDGPLPLDHYVAACLADPDDGYYAAGAPIGRAGDFITAPEISQVFGELIGLWAAAVWEGLGRPDPVLLVELGPGRGTMMADALRAIGQTLPPFAAALAPILIETSPALRAAQAAALAGSQAVRPPRWFDRFEALPIGQPMILLANEFFDALPVRQLVFAEGAWRERRVAIGPGGALIAVLGEEDAGAAMPSRLAQRLDPPAAGDVVELSPASETLAAMIARRIATTGGAALIIDYGPARSGCGDTLQAVAGHRFADPFAEPGAADLSHHVDFEALADAAAAAGAATWGPIAQGLFLGRLGIAERAALLIAAAGPEARQGIEGAVRRLVHPGRMGVLFKALAITAAGEAPPPGFARA